MKLILTKNLSRLLFCMLLTSFANAQPFWTETFGSGCNSGTAANAFTSPNGQWTTETPAGNNGADANTWYVSAEENGVGVGNCGTGCGSNPTLHIGDATADTGATYLTDGSGFGYDVLTDTRAESPVIDCSGQCGIDLTFEYLENGDGTNDNFTLWYFDGGTWTQLDDPVKTPLTCAPDGEWSSYSTTLPASADNNPNVQLGFRWVNNTDGVGTDPSVAIYNIQLSSTDGTDPSITCDGNVDVYISPSICEAQVPDLILPPTVVVSDNCTDDSDLLVSQDVASGTTIAGHGTTITVNVTVEDLSGNTNSCAIDVTALDTAGPVMACPSTQTIEADATCEGTLDDYISLATINDNCSAFGDLTITQNPTQGTTISSDQLVEISATDNLGNTNSCDFMVELVDTTAPVITCPPTQTQSTALNSCDTLLLDYTDEVVWNDNCVTDVNNMTFQQSPSPMLTVSGTTTVDIEVFDLDGNSTLCSFDVEVIDEEAPEITCASDLTIATDASCEVQLPDFSGNIGLNDNCSNNTDIVVTQSPSIGTVISGEGTVQTITMTAEDEAGNTNACTFDVTLSDTTSPQITCPGSQTESAGASCDFTVPDYSAALTLDDNCSAVGDLLVSQDVAVNSSLPVGSHTVEMTVEDESGNTSNCSFTLDVIDDIDPTINSCAPDQVENAGANCEANIGDYRSQLSATDNCDATGDLNVTQSPAPGSLISGTTTVTLTVTDLSGNSSTCDLEVTLNDVINPVPDCSSDTIVTVNASCGYNAPDVTGIVGGTDNCSSLGDMTLTQDIAPGTNLNGAQSIEVTLIDENGNSSSCFVDIIPDDTIAPDIACPSDQVFSNGTNCNYAITDFTALATVSDNCGTPAVSQIPAVGTAIGTGMHEVIFVATDAAGNADSCSFMLTITESVNPVITCPDDTTTCDPVVNYDLPAVTENCNGYQLTQIDASGYSIGDEFPIGITTQTYEVADSSGNTATCTFDVEVLEYPDTPAINTTTTGLCDTTSLGLNAENPSSGTGEWSVTTGGATISNELANNTGATSLTYGDNTFVWTISTTNCGSLSDSLIVTVYEQPLPASLQDSLYLCQDTSINIAANQPSSGSGAWSDVDGVVNFLDSSSANTLAYDFQGGWNDLTWTITNGTCPPSSDTMSVFYMQEGDISNDDTTVCVINDGINLSGTATFGDINSIWYVIEGGADFANSTSSSTLVTNLDGGKNVIVFGQNHPFCPTTLDTITVTAEQCGEYQPVIPTVITPNEDGRNDLFVVKNLNILYPEAQVKIVNRWGDLVFESEGYEKPWNGTLMNKGEQLPVGTYFYRILLNDGEGNELKGSISIIR